MHEVCALGWCAKFVRSFCTGTLYRNFVRELWAQTLRANLCGNFMHDMITAVFQLD